MIYRVSPSQLSLLFLSTIRNDNQESTTEDTLFAKITDRYFLYNSIVTPLIGDYNTEKSVRYAIIISNYP